MSILIFHRVVSTPDPLLPDLIDRRQFDKILSWLKSWFNILPLTDAVRHLRQATLPARAACITFDDGYADNYINALPILQRHELNATFFIATGFLDGGRMWNDTLIESIRSTRERALDLRPLGLEVIEMKSLEARQVALQRVIPALKHLSSEARSRAVHFVAEQCRAFLPDDLMLTSTQLQRLHATGMIVGAHTVTHPILVNCPLDTARQEIVDSRKQLEELTSSRVQLFAYPNGKHGRDYTVEHARLVADLGFTAAVSTEPGTSQHGDDLFQLRRFTPWDRKRWRFGLRLMKNLVAKSRP